MLFYYKYCNRYFQSLSSLLLNQSQNTNVLQEKWKQMPYVIKVFLNKYNKFNTFHVTYTLPYGWSVLQLGNNYKYMWFNSRQLSVGDIYVDTNVSSGLLRRWFNISI